ncbi:MAG TPA: ABC transporter ATP-binding protein [Tepidisphaeraceae bacterium]
MQAPTSSRQRDREFRLHGPAAGSTNNPKNGQLPSGQRRKFLGDYIDWLRPYAGRLAIIFLLALFVATLDLVWPLLIKFLVDALSSRNPDWPGIFHQLNLLGAGIVLLIVAKEVIDTFRGYRLAVLNAQVVLKLRRRLFDHIIHLPIGVVSDMKSGGVVSRLSGDAELVSGLVQSAIISPGVAGVRIILTLSILMAVSWRLAIAALITMPFLGATSFVWLRRARPIYRSIRDDYSTIDSRVTETFGGLRVVRAFRRETREGKNYVVGHHTVIRKTIRATWIQLILEAVWGVLIPLTALLVVWYGGHLMSRGHATIGDIFMFQFYSLLLVPPIMQIVQSVSTTQRSLAAMERIFTTLQTPQDKPDSPDAIDAPTQIEQMRFERVNFEYRAEVQVLHDFNLTVPGGATVALVGPSGAGKTTVTDLVARFHDPTSGAILLNGTDLRKMRLKSYRSLLAIVQQDTFLFDGTVRENISYGLSRADDAQIIDAARRANAHEFIEKLPEAYDTLVGERGVKLSGGQQQRLSIARAILADPQILILDEATSSLDTESEQLIQASLQELFKGRTTFVIAHRLGTITHADLIVVLLGGRIVEVGNHEQLVAKGGMYYQMVERQRQSFDVLGNDRQILQA